MEELIIKLAKGEKVTDKDIEYSDLTPKSVMEYARTGAISEENLSTELYEICDSEHSSCNSSCPVYKLNGNTVPSTKPFDENRGCDCFKHGSEMLNFIRKNA
jgi:hypothetical protein